MAEPPDTSPEPGAAEPLPESVVTQITDLVQRLVKEAVGEKAAPAAAGESRLPEGIRAADRRTERSMRDTVRSIVNDLEARKAHEAEHAALRTPARTEQPPAPPVTPWRERLWGGGSDRR